VLQPGTGIKAAGGISSWPLAAAVLDAGATRVGASSGIAMLDQFAAVTGPSAGA
jgi:deoxyribose-phosphate aldolase